MEERVVCRFRANLVFTFLLVVLGALGLRLFWIQVLHHDRYAGASLRQHIETVREPARRGELLDRRGRVLATSVLVPSIAVDPSRLEDPDAAARDLAAVLRVDEAALLGRIRRGRYFAWVRRGVDDPALLRRVRELDLPAGALIEREEMRRVHPMGPLAGQVVGVVDVDGRGLEGLERVHDAALRGRAGSRTVYVDARGGRIAVPGTTALPAVPGRDVRLTLDAVIQGFAEEQLALTVAEHSPRMATAIVLDARNGEILALASSPTFDPGNPGASDIASRRCRAITDMVEPGSTMKPLVVAAAIEAGAIAPDATIDTGEGWVRIGSRVVHEHEPRGYGRIPVEQVLVHSSNCGMARIGLALGIPRQRAALAAYGFGARTGVGLPGESAGTLHPVEQWSETWTLVSTSFGQEMAVTPLQLAAAYTAIAGDGSVLPPRLVLRDGASPADGRKVLSAATAKRVRGMMEAVVQEGSVRRLRELGYRIAGKTGTAQKLLRNGDVKAYVSSFVGVAPAADPRLVCLVLLDEPTVRRGTPYGSIVAAPFCGEILRRSLRYLGVRPDEGDRERP